MLKSAIKNSERKHIMETLKLFMKFLATNNNSIKFKSQISLKSIEEKLKIQETKEENLKLYEDAATSCLEKFRLCKIFINLLLKKSLLNQCILFRFQINLININNMQMYYEFNREPK